MLNSLLALAAALLVTGPSAAQQSEWPRSIAVPEGTVTFWMPQLDEWREGQITGRCAGSLNSDDGAEANFVLTFRARTDLDRTRRRVGLSEVSLPALSVAREATPDSPLPSSADLDSLRELVSEVAPDLLDSITLDEVLAVLPDAAFTGAPQPSNPDEVRGQLTSDPQARMGDWLTSRESWLVSRERSLVRIPKGARLSVPVAGPPKLTACEGAQVEIVTNCALSLLKTNGRFYCCAGGAWWEGVDLQSPLSPSESLPAVLLMLPDEFGLAPLSAIRALGGNETELLFSWDARAFPALAGMTPATPSPADCPAPPGLPPWFPLRSGEPTHACTTGEILALAEAPRHDWAVISSEATRFVGRDGRVWKLQDQRWWRESRSGGWEDNAPGGRETGFSLRSDLPAARYEFEVTQKRSDPIVWRLERERFRRGEAEARRARWLKFLECTAAAAKSTEPPQP